jgi:hypothetical protein
MYLLLSVMEGMASEKSASQEWKILTTSTIVHVRILEFQVPSSKFIMCGNSGQRSLTKSNAAPKDPFVNLTSQICSDGRMVS